MSKEEIDDAVEKLLPEPETIKSARSKFVRGVHEEGKKRLIKDFIEKKVGEELNRKMTEEERFEKISDLVREFIELNEDSYSGGKKRTIRKKNRKGTRTTIRKRQRKNRTRTMRKKSRKSMKSNKAR